MKTSKYSILLAIVFGIFLSQKLHSKSLSSWCYDEFEGSCLSKRNVNDIIPCLRVNFNALPVKCDDYKPLILQSLRRLDPVDTAEIKKCEKTLVKGCFASRSSKRIYSCMRKNLRNFSPSCQQLKIETSGKLRDVLSQNKRIKRHVFKCSNDLFNKCRKLKTQYKKYHGCIKEKLTPDCRDLFLTEKIKIKKVYDQFEIANMEYKCGYEKQALCQKKILKEDELLECQKNSKNKLSMECQEFYREVTL